MKKYIQIILICLLGLLMTSFGSPNCSQFEGDCFWSCKMSELAIKSRQGSRNSQLYFDKAIELCPTFAYAPYEKSVPYGKRGLMKEWKALMDKAVELKPKEYLGIRGWDHFIWMRNYEAAISDIEKLEELLSYDIGMTGDGTYHLHILRGLAYKGLGKYDKALEVMETQMAKPGYQVGLYDHFHVGVLYLELQRYDEALSAFEKQKEEYENSELHFYTARLYGKLREKDKQVEHLEKALDLYDKGKTMHNPYRQLMDRIYRLDISELLDHQSTTEPSDSR